MNDERSDLARHPIRVVSRRTGLTPAVLRAWEMRYGVVVPQRSAGGQRLYSDEDVRRLGLLRRAVEGGRTISQVANLSMEALEGLVQEDAAGRVGPSFVGPPQSSQALETLALAEKAVNELDGPRLERILRRSSMALPIHTVLEGVVVPLLESIGVSWCEERFGPGHEHLATVQIRRFLEWLLHTVGDTEGAPVMVTATPSGERHELGALLSAVSGGDEGWRAVFLGPDLPADEIALAAQRLDAQVVGISSVDEGAAGSLILEVEGLRSRLPGEVHLILGGPQAVKRKLVLEEKGVEVLDSQEELRKRLRTLQ